MPNTTNYSFPTPADTDLVKNGADAIRDLGDAVDTAMNTALGTKKAGMVLLNTTSFTGVTSVSLPAATFTSTYQNYRIVSDVTASSSGALLQLRLRTAGSDNTTTNHFNLTQGLDSNAAAANILSKAQTSFTLMVLFNEPNFLSLDVFSPQATKRTSLSGTAVGINAAANEYTGYRLGSLFTATTSFDSLTFIASTGNIAGKIQVFGYND